ncbi:pyruvate dehydrogenase subunit E1 [Roseobacter sp. SK209-2-6]|uniref:alpha-ketoglutarate dehydrogenase n=1 Tax=Roseobacter sp. SK209-2-6 TaxID=388739 RepID=UPI0000F3C197|nr:alpha-ketoglutarate dehydrogenase [Roseobacter sp. SK209-2-6]EBA15419.1 pyruvate dehydrogenase subunit E1 [Roseobacter sp. SK209-2-6]
MTLSLHNSETDTDPAETQEWIDALVSTKEVAGTERAQHILKALEDKARVEGLLTGEQPYSSYRNTIPVEEQGVYPGDLEIENRLTSIIRWNALATVVRANEAYGGLGGHIASYASAAEIFEMGFNHFFRARTEGFGGDLVYFQPHSAPGIYARANLEGRLSREQLDNYRQEVAGNGLCSYPHPWLMPDFWQVPTGSMGIGPLSAVYQARYMRYLQDRGLAETEGRHVWGVYGDGEMDEPESIAGLTLAAREGLDNLTFIVNCNLQRLDGPVRGNGQVIQELESLFIGAGWNVIKVLWGSEWDELFARDKDNVLLSRFAQTVDGQYQNLGAKDGDYNRDKFFNADPRTAQLVSHMTEEEINNLKRGGHDFRKLYAAFAAAKAHKGRPTVILAKTKKGYGMGGAGESRMIAHQAKKLDTEALYQFRDRFNLPMSDEDVEKFRIFQPEADSPEMEYLRERRTALGGFLPKRERKAPENTVAKVPDVAKYAKFALEADGKEMSTTMAAVRMMGGMLKDKAFGPRLVPIVADEARTFGMDNLFRQIGIYAPDGQLYEPEDAGSMMYYKEAKNGQMLEEGITEAGALSSWTAAATSYSIHGMPMLPIYIYYSMFGFQRVGDLIWAAADQRSRGFLLGATAGRTTLSGEGLQHQDGTSHLISATVPNCRSYDPAFAYELAVIMDQGSKRMMEEQIDEFYYITVMNENYAQPSLPKGSEDDIIKGLHRVESFGDAKVDARVNLVGAGTILLETIEAAKLLERDFGIASDVFSATSFSELSRDAEQTERLNRYDPLKAPRQSHVQKQLGCKLPVIAATDYVRAVPQMIAQHLPQRFVALGTDGFGRSDQRANLRSFFEVDRYHIALAAIEALVREGTLEAEVQASALEKFSMRADKPAPWTV